MFSICNKSYSLFYMCSRSFKFAATRIFNRLNFVFICNRNNPTINKAISYIFLFKNAIYYLINRLFLLYIMIVISIKFFQQIKNFIIRSVRNDFFYIGN